MYNVCSLSVFGRASMKTKISEAKDDRSVPDDFKHSLYTGG